MVADLLAPCAIKMRSKQAIACRYPETILSALGVTQYSAQASLNLRRLSNSQVAAPVARFGPVDHTGKYRLAHVGRPIRKAERKNHAPVAFLDPRICRRRGGTSVCDVKICRLTI